MRKAGIQSERPLVLVVDDDITIRILAREALEQAGFEVEEAENGIQALSAFQQVRPDIVLLDVMMPDMDGFDVCASIGDLPVGEQVPVVMITGMDDIESIKRAYEAGATDFIAKPINWVIFSHRIQHILRANQAFGSLRRSEATNRAILNTIPDLMLQMTRDGTLLDSRPAKYIDLPMADGDLLHRKVLDVFPGGIAHQIMDYLEKAFASGAIQIFEFQLSNNGKQHYYEARILVSDKDEALAIVRDITEQKQQEKRLSQSMNKLRKATAGIVRVIASTVERRDPYTAGHQARVANLARNIAGVMGLSKDNIAGIYIAGIIHDLGKISVPAEILSKPVRLNDIELDLIRTHPQVGYDILKNIEFERPVADIVLQHHERMDGSGYPLGLSGQAILIEARILAVADVVEAMASHRPYRPALGIGRAIEEISQNRGTRYDSRVVDACLKVISEKDSFCKRGKPPVGKL
jgi:response regulator RpfG family c-di-GMP phosphodiesterase